LFACLDACRYSSPLLSNGMAVLGEYSKAIAVSAQRFSSITASTANSAETTAAAAGDDTEGKSSEEVTQDEEGRKIKKGAVGAGVTIGLLGSQGEEVTVAVWTGQAVVTKTTTIGSDGTATLQVSALA